MIDKICQDQTGVFLVVSQLRAAVGVRKGDYAVDSIRPASVSLCGDGLSHAVDTANGGNDPDLVADTGLSAAAPVFSSIPFLRNERATATLSFGWIFKMVDFIFKCFFPFCKL